MKQSKLNTKPVISLILAASLMIAIATSSEAAPVEPESRVTHSQHLRGDDRENAVELGVTQNEYDKYSEGGRRSSKTSSGARDRGLAAAALPNTDFWFYLADVELYADDDRDGYYSGIDLLFDVDTYYSVADIYAVVYLSFEGGPWEEYAETEDFTIFGSSGTDDYILITDLVSGYPTGDYDLLIEVFDADNGDFLAFIGPEDTSELAFLPLEDMNRDAVTDTVTRVTVSSGGGGSIDGLLILMLAGLAIGRIRLRRS